MNSPLALNDVFDHPTGTHGIFSIETHTATASDAEQMREAINNPDLKAGIILIIRQKANTDWSGGIETVLDVAETALVQGRLHAFAILPNSGATCPVELHGLLMPFAKSAPRVAIHTDVEAEQLTQVVASPRVKEVFLIHQHHHEWAVNPNLVIPLLAQKRNVILQHVSGLDVSLDPLAYVPRVELLSCNDIRLPAFDNKKLSIIFSLRADFAAARHWQIDVVDLFNVIDPRNFESVADIHVEVPPIQPIGLRYQGDYEATMNLVMPTINAISTRTRERILSIVAEAGMN